MSEQSQSQIAPNVDLDDPVQDVTNALIRCGHPNPTAWLNDLRMVAPLAFDNSTPSVWRRSMANRAIHIQLSESNHPKQQAMRFMLVDMGTHAEWKTLIDETVAPFLTMLANQKAST